MPRMALTALFTRGAGSVTARTQRSINWGLVGLLITCGIALLAREWVLYDAIGAKAAKSEVYAIEKEMIDYRAEARALNDRLMSIEQMQLETRNDVKQLLKESR